MEVDWPRKQNATDVYSKSSHALDHRRKQEEGTTKRDVEKVRGARDEGYRVELGPGRKAGSEQTTMAFLGVGLMCKHARRGLSGSRHPIITQLRFADKRIVNNNESVYRKEPHATRIYTIP